MYKYVAKNIVAISDTVSFDDETKAVETDNILHSDFVSKSRRKLYNIYSVNKFYGAPPRKLVSRNIIGNRRFDTRFRNGEDTLFFFLIIKHVLRVGQQFTIVDVGLQVLILQRKQKRKK